MTTDLRRLQAAWVTALLHPDSATAAEHWAAGIRTPAAGFAVYVNSVRANTRNALAISYPATRALIGERAFAKAVLACLQTHPPTAGDLAEYGAAFADAVAATVFGESREVAHELARHEWLLDQLPRCPRTPASTLAEAAQIPAENWQRLRLNAAGHCVEFISPVPVRAWRAYLLDGGASPPPHHDERCLIVADEDAGVSILPLGAADWAWWAEICRSGELTTATTAGLALDSDFKLLILLERLFGVGALRIAEW